MVISAQLNHTLCSELQALVTNLIMKQEYSIEQITRILSDLESQLNEIPPSKKATSVNKDEQASEKPVVEKKPSRWVRFRERFKIIGKVKKEESGSSRPNTEEDEDEAKADLMILKLQSDIRQMKSAFENLTKFQSLMTLELGLPSKKLKAILEKKDSIKFRSDDLKLIRNKILDLKCQIPSLLYKQPSRGLSTTDSQTAEENNINETGSDIYLPGLHVSPDLNCSSAFEEIVEKFQGLDFTKQLCLMSFAVFPENREVKRTMLMYWWIGEEFISCEDPVTEILDEFSSKGLLEPVEDERKLKPTSYKMEPHVHSAVIYLAKYVDLFDLYSPNGKLIMKNSKREKVCLVKGSSLQQEAKTSVMKPKSVKTVFNSSERYPDFTFKWFPEMESLKVLYLGRWERTAKRHIEVESTEFLKNMKSLKNLRLASFQGISRIEKLEKSICALPKLVILDLRACYNLEVLPEDIGSLDNLIYLDVSECYMLDRMPKGIADLLRLQVLKGFVISQSDEENNCAVKHLLNLKKLSITVNKYLFKVENLMESLKDLEKLESLKISWGARFPEEERKGNKSEAEVLQNKDLKEQEDDQVRKENVEETGKQQVGPEDGKKRQEVKPESLKSDKVVEGEKKTSPSRESTATIQNKPNDQKGKSKVEEEGDGDKGKVNQEEAKKQDEVGANKSKSGSGVEDEVKKAIPSRESTDAIQNKQDDKSKVEKEGNGDKGKADLVEGKKRDEEKAESSKSDSGVEGVTKASTLQESTDAVQNKPDDHQRGEKQEDKADGEKKKVNLEEGKNKDEVKAESSKPDKVIEGDEKTNPLQESKDTVHSKPDDQKEERTVQEKGDGEKNGDGLRKLDEGQANTHKSDKKTKLGKKVSFSEEALNQKKPDDLKRDDAMTKGPEKTAPKQSRSSKAKLSMGKRNETKRWGIIWPENPPTHTSKLPSSLKNLELECFPEKKPPRWLNPDDLKNLRKLSIRGGKLSRISGEPPTAQENWNVQILRLKYLHEFKAEWKELQALFPQMELLEKYQCPKVAFCPTDGNGVWRSQPKASPDMPK